MQYNREAENKAALFITMIVMLRYLLVRMVDLVIEEEDKITLKQKNEDTVEKESPQPHKIE